MLELLLMGASFAGGSYAVVQVVNNVARLFQ